MPGVRRTGARSAVRRRLRGAGGRPAGPARLEDGAVTDEAARVLFVCRANACRSPVAAELFRRHLSGDTDATLDIVSAGIDARDVRVREDAVEALAEAGVDLTRHQPTPLTSELLRDSDVVVTMERAVVRTAVNTEPTAWPRTFTLKELV